MTIMNDFKIEYERSNYHVLNIVSPGWTCGMPVANHIVDKIFEVIDKK
jgi:hypothetical protein